MKYMIMTFGDQSGLGGQVKDWIREMIEFMHTLDEDLPNSGELAYEHGLADASQAKPVGIKNGIPVATDGALAESKKSHAGS